MAVSLRFYKKLLRTTFSIIAVIILLLQVATPTIYGQTKIDDEQKKLYRMGISYYDIAACGVAANSSSLTDSGGALYMLGDSITVGAQQQLETEIKEKGYTAFINASESRSIKKAGTTEGFKTSGLDAIETDAVNIKDAKVVVIALGTNQDSEFDKAMKQLIDKVKATNKDAEIYWVNVFSKIPDKDKINDSIESVANKNDVTLIDTSGEDIPLGKDDIHPNTPGQQAFAEIVADSITKGVTDEKPVADCSCAADSGVQLSGKDNGEKIFNFFVSKGLTPFQAAGIAGNMFHESGWEPQTAEGLGGQKTSADEFMAGRGGPGWGIVQFTPGSKFINPTKAAKKDPNDLSVQLEFVWTQLQGKGPVPEEPIILKQIKATKNVEEAVKAFQGTQGAGGQYRGYERPADQAGSVPERTKKAKELLNAVGSGGGGGAMASGTDVSCELDANNAATGEYSLPVDKKWFSSNKDWFTKPHHDYPSADIPVPSGNKIFAVVGGSVTQIGSGYGGGYGTSVYVKDKDGIIHIYAHGTPGSVKVSVGDEISAGKLLMLSDNSGHSTGAHLHYEIRDGGTKRCPQSLLEAIGESKPTPSIKELPSSGCTN